MALSPADFAAYSRAIGAPYPESPEERALMVPEVRAFRQNQLQAQPQQESNSLALGLGIGLGLAGVGGGLMALRGRGKKGAKKDVAGKSSVKMTDLSNQPEPKSKTAVYADVAAKPKKDVAGKSSVKVTDLSDQPIPKSKTAVYADVAAKAEEDLPNVYAPSGGTTTPDLLTDSVTGEMYRPGGQSFAKKETAQEIPTKQTPQSFLERYQERDQPAAMTAVEQYRQMTGSDPYKEAPKKGLLKAQEGTRQRIEDLGNIVLADLQNDATLEQQANTVINELRQEPTTLVTSQESRLPILQEQATDALASTDDNVTNRVRLDAQRNEDLDLATGIERPATGDPFGVSVETAQDIDLIQESRQVSAKSFLENERDEIASQLGEQGLIVTPGRVEKELANRLGTEAYQYGPKYIKRKHALELGATYDPEFFENLNVSSVKIAGENVPVNPTKQTRVSRTEMLGTPFEEDVKVG